MDYFDDLNPYLVKEDDNENLTRQQTVPPTQPVEQTYVENILRVNVGKKGTFYFSYTGSKTWNDKIYTGTLQQAGRDHFIIVTDTGKTVMLLQKMKGYATSEGYMGLVQGRYMLFASEVDYREYMED